MKKLRRREELSLEELQTRATDVGLVLAKIDGAEIRRCFKDVLPKRELREFRTLVDGLHRHFLRFRDQSQA
jgi:hypothetical protein